MANQYWVTKCNKLIDAIEYLPIMFSVFGKADTWIKDDVFSLNSCSKGLFELHRYLFNNIGDDIVIDGL